MPNDTLRANAQAMPIDRRAALGSLAAAAAAMLAAPRVAKAAGAAEPDAEVIGLVAEIVRRAAKSERFQKTRIDDPFREEFEKIAHTPGRVTRASLDKAFAYSREIGRDAAIEELHAFDEITDGLFNRLMAIPATTQAGRAAKVRALLVHVMLTEWRGPRDELDWEKEMMRALLGEFAGMSAAELEAI